MRLVIEVADDDLEAATALVTWMRSRALRPEGETVAVSPSNGVPVYRARIASLSVELDA